MTKHESGEPPKRSAAYSTHSGDEPRGNHSTQLQRREVVVFDWRCAARDTETGLDDIARALTATGLAWDLRQCADRIGQP